MSEGLNKVMLIGNLGQDPELRVTPGGQSILKMRLATSETYLDKSNTRQERRTEWHSITMWGKRGEALAKFLKKGERIYVEGSLRTSSYEKDGEKRYRTEVIASNVILNGSGGGRSTSGDENDPRPSARTPRGRNDGTYPDAPADDGGGDYIGGDDSDIPF
jgi:single-strand DNA-binding protein